MIVKEKSTDRYQRMYEQIRERICTLYYPPGHVLNETTLAAEFKVSRTPLRRVLQQLSYEGLLEIKNGVGTIVTDINMKAFKDIYDLRIVLAESMGDLSPNPITAKHIEEIDKLIERGEALHSDRITEKYAILCNDLEKLLIDVIGSRPLKEMTDVLYYRVARIWFTFLPNLNWEEAVGSLINELNEMRNAMQENDVRAIGRIRSTDLRRMLNAVSSYMSGT